MSAATAWRIGGGTALDRDHLLQFTFNGGRYSGYRGDTLASALLANGVRIVGRSFKFHRPRGVFSCGVEEPNAFVQLESGARSTPSVRSTVLELYQGLQARVPSGWPSLNFDCGRLLDVTSSLWAAGFYNKTFIWPSWHTYEGVVRRMAGFGELPTGPDPDRYDVLNLHCDVLVVGGGVAGLEAASTAAQSGARVLLAEQQSMLGGRCSWDGSRVDGAAGTSWIQAAAERLAQAADVQVLTRTTAVAVHERHIVTLVQSVPEDEVRNGRVRERLLVVRAGQIVTAAGAIEQPLIFCNNDRPGVMLAGAVREYLRRFAVVAGRQVVVATNNDTAYALVRELREAGVQVPALADTRHDVPRVLADELRDLGVPLLRGSIPVDTKGFSALSSVRIASMGSDFTRAQGIKEFTCDCLAVSGGWNPTLHLNAHASGKLGYAHSERAFGAPEHPSVLHAGYSSHSTVGPRLSGVGKSARQWVDLRHDVTRADIELAIRENYASIEHVKRYTTTGMAADQGKTSSLAAIEIVGQLRDLPPAEIGHTTIRPPFVPLTLGAIAGREVGEHFAPSRSLPLHDWHTRAGGVLEDYGEWRRPAVYLRGGESRANAVTREARAVRTSAGLFDASSLGKIEVQGPDALEFLDRFYLNDLRTLKPLKARYGLMLRESGVLFDDGTVVMLSPDHLLVSTTSGNARRVYAWLEEWHQCEWPTARVALTSTTDQWAVLTLAGPRAREILTSVATGSDLDTEQFPHLAMREMQLLGHPARVYRISFTGELSYEINVPAQVAAKCWEALYEAGAPFGLQPFGLDALQLLRLEKGFMHIGTDTDGTTVPEDVGWGKVAAAKRGDFIGKRSLLLPENTRRDRLQLVGLKSDTQMVVGSHIRRKNSTEVTDGWVTSTGCAILTGESIALALVRSGRESVGESVSIHNGAAVTSAVIVRPPFFDAAGERMNG